MNGYNGFTNSISNVHDPFWLHKLVANVHDPFPHIDFCFYLHFIISLLTYICAYIRTYIHNYIYLCMCAKQQNRLANKQEGIFAIKTVSPIIFLYSICSVKHYNVFYSV